ncbi:hypothetical protein TrVFT333_001345 [Trichoderma virens FT-333]|nr:hypothetical protein TrVFT333_001345 [Trichoderma virens FT-333]
MHHRLVQNRILKREAQQSTPGRHRKLYHLKYIAMDYLSCILRKEYQIQIIIIRIVAVHGLNGKARGTWTDKDSGMLWLEHFLPEDIPDARIMTFGYDSSLMFSQSKGRIEDFARDLLNRLWMLRQLPQEKNRPLIFVCHSLGGIVVKKALVLAHELNHQYHNIVTSTIGIVFMGTPHRGADIVNWTSFLTNAIKVVSGNQILDYYVVHRDSDRTPLNVLVVPTESSQLGLPNEMVFPVNAHHRSICRYSSAKDQTYILVKTSIKSIVSDPRDSPSSTAVDEIAKHIIAPAQIQRVAIDAVQSILPPAVNAYDSGQVAIKISGLRKKRYLYLTKATTHTHIYCIFRPILISMNWEKFWKSKHQVILYHDISSSKVVLIPFQGSE